jgi:hypothetical protein
MTPSQLAVRSTATVFSTLGKVDFWNRMVRSRLESSAPEKVRKEFKEQARG